MSTPYLRTRALVQAKELLRTLADIQASPGVPESVRVQATSILQHYPTLLEVQKVHEALPDLFGPAPPFSRLRGNPQTDSVLSAASEAVDNGPPVK